MPAQRFRSRDVEVEAVLWDGSNLSSLAAFTGPGNARIRGTGLEIRNTQDAQWLSVPPGHWVVKGTLGEFYPCSPAALENRYTWAGPARTEGAPA